MIVRLCAQLSKKRARRVFLALKHGHEMAKCFASLWPDRCANSASPPTQHSLHCTSTHSTKPTRFLATHTRTYTHMRAFLCAAAPPPQPVGIVAAAPAGRSAPRSFSCCRRRRRQVQLSVAAAATTANDDDAPSSSSSPSSTPATVAAALPPATAAAAAEYNWRLELPSPPPTTTSSTTSSTTSTSSTSGRLVRDVPVAAIRRPLGRTRANDGRKVLALMASIKEVGLLEPIDVLEVDGVIYGFSGCHRYEAHVRLGAETIRCRVRRATREVLQMHLR